MEQEKETKTDKPIEVRIIREEQPSYDLFYDKTYLIYLLKEERDALLLSYVEQNFPEVSWKNQISLMLAFPYFANKILDDYELDDYEKQEKLLNNLSYGKSKIIGIFGSRGSGKTADASWIIDELYKRKLHKKIYWVKEPEPSDKIKFPLWIKIIAEIEEVPDGVIAIIDESSIRYNARNFWKQENKDFISRLVILRHKNTSVILISQHPMLIDKSIRRLLDIIIYKKGATLVHKEEREDNEKVMVRNRLSANMPNESLIEFQDTFLKFSHPLPDWWNDYISKSYKNYNPEKISQQYFKKQKEDGFEREKQLKAFELEKMKELGLTPKISKENKRKEEVSVF